MIFNNPPRREVKYPDVEKGRYYIEEDGRIWDSKSERYMSQSDRGQGYLAVSLQCENKDRPKRIDVHRIMMHTYDKPPTKNKNTVDHKNSDKLNNHYDNLQWMSRAKNRQKAAKENGKTTISEEDVKRLCEYHEAHKDMTLKKMSKELNIPYHSVRKIINGPNWNTITKDYNFSVRNKRLSKEEEKKIVEYRQEGMSGKDIADKLNRPSTTIYSAIKRLNK